MVFSTKHIPGALYQILGLLNTFEINMTKIESRPSEKQLGDYWFWIDTTMEKLNKKTDVFFEILNTKCSYFRILGIY
jgi:prephenate dehydratase